MTPPIKRHERLDRLAITLLIVCCAFWGLQQILIKSTLPEIPAMWQAAMRFWIATVLLWLWCLWRGIPLFNADKTLGAGLLAGGLFAAEFIGIYGGLTYTNASRLTVFLYSSVFVVALLLPRFVPSERLNLKQWAGLVIAFCAVAIAFSEGLLSTDTGHWRGDLLAIAAAIFWGLTTLVLAGHAVIAGICREGFVLPDRHGSCGDDHSLSGGERAVDTRIQQLRVVVVGASVGGGRLCELSHLDVDAAPLPGDTDGVVYFFNARVRADFRRRLFGRAPQLAAFGRDCRCGRRDLVGQPERPPANAWYQVRHAGLAMASGFKTFSAG